MAVGTTGRAAVQQQIYSVLCAPNLIMKVPLSDIDRGMSSCKTERQVTANSPVRNETLSSDCYITELSDACTFFQNNTFVKRYTNFDRLSFW